MVLLGEEEDSGQIVDEVIQDLLIFGLCDLDQRFPELDAVGFVLEDDALQFLVDFSHEPRHHRGDLLVLGSQRVDEQFDNAAALFLETELGGISEDRL